MSDALELARLRAACRALVDSGRQVGAILESALRHFLAGMAEEDVAAIVAHHDGLRQLWQAVAQGEAALRDLPGKDGVS